LATVKQQQQKPIHCNLKIYQLVITINNLQVKVYSFTIYNFTSFARSTTGQMNALVSINTGH
jgi:hypothetical protein